MRARSRRLGDGDLVDQRRRGDVDVGEPGEVGEVVLVGGEVVDRVDATHQVREELPVTDVAHMEVDARREVGRFAVAVHGRGQGVEDDDVVAELDQSVTRVGADEPRSAGDEDPHRRPPRRAYDLAVDRRASAPPSRPR